jgi:hypothetical protein
VIDVDGETAFRLPSRILWQYLKHKGLLTMSETNGELTCNLKIKPETLIQHAREYLQRPLLWRLAFQLGLVPQVLTMGK